MESRPGASRIFMSFYDPLNIQSTRSGYVCTQGAHLNEVAIRRLQLGNRLKR